MISPRSRHWLRPVLRFADVAIVGAVGLLAVVIGLFLFFPDWRTESVVSALALALWVPLFGIAAGSVIGRRQARSRVGGYLMYPRLRYAMLALFFVGPVGLALVNWPWGPSEADQALAKFAEGPKAAVEKAFDNGKKAIDLIYRACDINKAKNHPDASDTAFHWLYRARVFETDLNELMHTFDNSGDPLGLMQQYDANPIVGGPAWINTIKISEQISKIISEAENGVKILDRIPSELPPGKLLFMPVIVRLSKLLTDLVGEIGQAEAIETKAEDLHLTDLAFDIASKVKEADAVLNKVRGEVEDAENAWRASEKTDVSKMQGIVGRLEIEAIDARATLAGNIGAWKTKLDAVMNKPVTVVRAIDYQPFRLARTRCETIMETARIFGDEAGRIGMNEIASDISETSKAWRSELQEVLESKAGQLKIWADSGRSSVEAAKEIEVGLPQRLNSLAGTWESRLDEWQQKLDIRTYTNEGTTGLWNIHPAVILGRAFGFGGFDGSTRTHSRRVAEQIRSGKSPQSASLERALNEASSDAERLELLDAFESIANLSYKDGKLEPGAYEAILKLINDRRGSLKESVPDIVRRLFAAMDAGLACEDVQGIITKQNETGLYLDAAQKRLIETYIGSREYNDKLKYWYGCLEKIQVPERSKQ